MQPPNPAAHIWQAFQGSQTEIVSWLQLITLNATTTLAIEFQNPLEPDPEAAAAHSAAAMLMNAAELAQAAHLNAQQTQQFIGAQQTAIDRFNQALTAAIAAGAPTNNRTALAVRVAQTLNLPV